MNKHLAALRLTAQYLAHPKPGATPTSIVAGFGAMQGQDPGVMNSVALRLPGDERATDVVDALKRHDIVRGYPIRTTVFLTTAKDLRWMTELCSPTTASWSRTRSEQHFGLTDADFTRLADVLTIHPLTQPDSPGLTRTQFRDILDATVDVEVTNGHIYRALFQLQVEHVLVQSGWNGKANHLFAAEPVLGPGLEECFNGDRLAATTELLARYLRTRGPATLRDFAWWSKLTLTDIREAAKQLPDDVEQFSTLVAASFGIDDAEQYFARVGLVDEHAARVKQATRPHLLPAFDEFILGYQDRLFAMTPAVHDRLVPGNRGIFLRPVIVDGTVRGAWRTTGSGSKRKLVVEPFSTVPKASEPGIRRAFKWFPFV